MEPYISLVTSFPGRNGYFQLSSGFPKPSKRCLIKRNIPVTVRKLFDSRNGSCSSVFYPETEKRGIYWHSLFYEEQIEIWTVGNGNLYGHSNTTERPILFFKGHGRDVVGHTKEVGIRYDAVKSISTSAIGVILNRALEVVGYTIGNDMSSSDIEGENPFYLSQARVYRASCALGPGIWLSSSNEIPSGGLKMRIERAGQIVFQGETHTDNIVYRLPELIDYLGRCNDFYYGVVLLINTEIVLPSDFTLQESDVVHISIDNIGTLTNTVKVV